MLKDFTRWKADNFLAESCQTASESLKFHIRNNASLCESVYRPGSESHFDLLREARELYDAGELFLEGVDLQLFSQTDIGKFGIYEGEEVPLDFVFEAEYDGREVELNHPMRGGKKKYHVYVKDPDSGEVKELSFGDAHGGLKARVSNSKARKSFAARHRCHLKKDKMTAGYWACRINRYAHLWRGKTYPGYW